MLHRLECLILGHSFAEHSYYGKLWCIRCRQTWAKK